MTTGWSTDGARVRWALWCAVGALACLLALPAGAAAAGTELSLTGSSFQGGDGDQVAADGKTDWATYAAQTSVQLDAPLPAGTGSDHYYSGHEDKPDEWVDAYVTDGVTPAKSNALGAWSLKDPLSTDLFFYFSFIRESASNANAFLGFELNKATTTWTNSKGTVVPCRSTGDLMISYEIDASAKDVAIKFYRWASTSAGPAKCPEGKTGVFSEAESFAQRQAYMNFEGAIANFLRPDVFTNTLQAGRFGEGAVDLSAALAGVVGAPPCFSFGQVQLHTRSSSAMNSALQDTVSPAPIVVANCDIEVDKKIARNLASADRHDPSKYSQGPIDANVGDTLNYEFTVTNPGTRALAVTFSDARCDTPPAGPTSGDTDGDGLLDPTETWKYHCDHVVVSADLPTLQGEGILRNTVRVEGRVPQCAQSTLAECGDSDSDSADARILGRIEIEKQNVGGAGTDPFTFTPDSALAGASSSTPALDAQGKFTLTDDGVHRFTDVVPNATGGYVVAEQASAGYRLTAIACNDGDSTDAGPTPAGVASSSATIKVSPGETVRCVFTNTKDGRVEVVKAADDGRQTASTEAFTFTPSAGLNGGAAVTASEANGAVVVDASAIPGSYDLVESAKAGWDLTKIDCADPTTNSTAGKTTGLTDRKASIDVAAGETVTCTFTNVKRGEIRVVKDAVDGSATASTESFSFTPSAGVNGGQAVTVSEADGARTVDSAVVPGSHQLAEGSRSGWDLTDIDCDDTDSTQGGADAAAITARTANVEVSPGEIVTCTFQNTKRGQVRVIKDAVDGSQTASTVPFTFTPSAGLNGGQAVSASEADGTRVVDGDVLPGSYQLTETAQEGWDLTRIDCQDPSADSTKDRTTDLADRTATINVGIGETVTCTFTNVQRGTLEIEKQTDPQEGASGTAFAFVTNASGGGFSLTDDGVERRSVRPGAYTVTEDWASGYRLSSIACTDGNSAGDVPSRTATYDISAGETVRCVFTNTKLSPATMVVKAGNEYAYHGDTLTYSFSVTNPGNSPLHDVSVADDRCPNVQLASKNGDTSPATLDPGDTWSYTCSTAVPAHTDGDTSLTNTVTVTARDEQDREVRATDRHVTRILHPAVDIEKSGPAEATAGDLLTYRLEVSNPGDVPFGQDRVAVGDPQCDAPPVRTSAEGDSTPSVLDPGDRWVYGCSRQTAAGEQAVENVASVSAQDFNGRTVSDQDTLVTRLVQPAVAVLPETRVSGTARLRSPSGCVGRPFTVRVSGREIRSATTFLDGRRYRSLRKVRGTNRWQLRINPRRMSYRTHRLTVRVSFTSRSRTAPRTLRVAFQRCARRAVKPSFTG